MKESVPILPQSLLVLEEDEQVVVGELIEIPPG